MTGDLPRLAARIGEVLQPPDLPVVIVATVGADGGPHTAPFGSCLAVAAGRLRFGSSRAHDTYDNVRRDSRVAVVLCAPPDFAVSIHGRASVIADSMQTNPGSAVIEIEIDNVKDDWFPGVVLTTGLAIEPAPERRDYLARYLAEVQAAGGPAD